MGYQRWTPGAVYNLEGAGKKHNIFGWIGSEEELKKPV